MATFGTPTDTADLAGPMSDLIGRFVAIRPLSLDLVTISTEYGPSKALRVQTVDLDSGVDAGVRLLFWSTVQRAVAQGAHAGLDWVVGIITVQPQRNDPTRSVYLLEPSSEMDADRVGRILDGIKPAEIV